MTRAERAVLVAAILTLFMLGTAFAPLPRLLDGASLMPAGGALLTLPATYVALAPLTAILDVLTLLTPREHGWLVVDLLLIGAAKAAVARGKRRRQFLVTGAAILTLYLSITVVPRPMAGLEILDRRDQVIVDFHSHTDASHDGRRRFDLRANADWHQQAGYDVAYVTEHRHGDAARRAAQAPVRSRRDDIVMLSGSEIVIRDAHVIALGRVDGGAPAVLLQTLPERWERLVPSASRIRADSGVHALEISDGAPRGLAQSRSGHDDLLRLADRYDLALVAVSDLHGWGRTASGWSVVNVARWRALPLATLDSSLQRSLAGGRHAILPIIRAPLPTATALGRLLGRLLGPALGPALGGALGGALVLPRIVVATARELSPGERSVTIGWIWLVVALSVVRARRAARERAPAEIVPDAAPRLRPAA